MAALPHSFVSFAVDGVIGQLVAGAASVETFIGVGVGVCVIGARERLLDALHVLRRATASRCEGEVELASYDELFDRAIPSPRAHSATKTPWPSRTSTCCRISAAS